MIFQFFGKVWGDDFLLADLVFEFCGIFGNYYNLCTMDQRQFEKEEWRHGIKCLERPEI